MLDSEKEDRIESSAPTETTSATGPKGTEEKKTSDGPTSEPSPASSTGDQNVQIPFSKARCIAIVITVTGASFMNVR
jgi:hypothetical protein